jgi:hypothetical protein
VNKVLIEKAANQFIGPGDIVVDSLGHGLIHHTYRATNTGTQKSVLLQAINTNVFKKPDDILYNYSAIYQYLQTHNSDISIPAPVITAEKKLLWLDEENNYWRATSFIHHTFSPDIASDEQSAYTVAKSFATFTRALAGLDAKELKIIIPNFHDLAFRYEQFEKAIASASLDRLLKSTHVIAELRQRKQLVDWYNTVVRSTSYPVRVMHHDCKISNILFNTGSGKVVCPVDLDTVMPGKFFSDLGDMIRSMACTVDENSNRWEEINIRPSFYQNILKGYLEGIGDIFTEYEKKDIHYTGMTMIYMQGIRFVNDFLNNDIYYKTSYPEQNLNRALNQLILLERLEEFLVKEYRFTY